MDTLPSTNKESMFLRWFEEAREAFGKSYFAPRNK
jgi:hypothetical protein